MADQKETAVMKRVTRRPRSGGGGNGCNSSEPASGQPDVKRQCADDNPYMTTAAASASGPLDGVRAYIVEAGIGKVRSDLFRSKIVMLGGSLSAGLADVSPPTHVIVDESMTADRLRRILRINNAAKFVEQTMEGMTTVVVRSMWLSECIRNRRVVDINCYRLDIGGSSNGSRPEIRQSSSLSTLKSSGLSQGPVRSGNIFTKSHRAPAAAVAVAPHAGIVIGSEADSDYETSSGDDEEAEDGVDDPQCPRGGHGGGDVVSYVGPKVLPKGSWVCARSSATGSSHNYNQHITNKLEALAKTYMTMNEKWRALSYQKAIMALKRCPKEITTFEEAKSLPGVGSSLAEKITEIMRSGELRKLNELASSDEMKALELFTNVWGAGPQTAHSWVRQGYRTLDDLRTATDGMLTKNQRIGLKYYDELLDRMPREEAARIEAVVRDAAFSIRPGLVAMACGSYRRGQLTCGDVDVLITHPDGRSHSGVFRPLISRLHTEGFLTDDLVSVEHNGDQKKYLGVCKLPGDGMKHRRLDIIVVPYAEFACALMYFTGSAHLNRSMRNLARRLGMSLNEHALYTGVVRHNGEKIEDGTPLHTPTEESIFNLLGLTYRPPEERDH